MAAQLANKTVVSRTTLEKLVELRLAEAQALFDAGYYVGCVYLAGYAVECALKHAICATLEWNDLKSTFKTHDLELLRVHSGLDARLQGDVVVSESFSKIREMWVIDSSDKGEKHQSLRYCTADVARIDRDSASLFLKWATDSKVGVIPWLRNETSRRRSE